jgi:PAS domain S-box-containing protein
MNFSLYHNLHKNPNLLAVLITAITALILVLNGYGLMIGITNVLPHLFYIPIVLTAYYFPRRGILFAVAVSALYSSLTYLYSPTFPDVLLSAGGRVVIFIVIGAAVSFLTLRLQESEALFRGVAERSYDIIILTDRDGRATYVSPSVVKILGYDPAEIVGKLPGDFVHPEDLGLILESFPARKGGLSGDIAVRFRKKTGDFAVMEFSGTPIVTKGTITGLQVIGRDVTARTVAETALRESEEKYRTLADYTYDWEYWIAPDESILYTTPSCERITGYTPEEFYADRALVKSILLPEDNNALAHHITHSPVPMKPQSVDFRIVHRDGSIRWIGHVCQPVFNANGEFVGRRASNRDITERKQAEEAYRETSRRLAEIIDFLPDPTMVVDKDGVIAAWNHAMELMSGIPASAVVSRSDHSYTSWLAGQVGPVLIDFVLRRDIEGVRAAYPNVHFEGDTIKTERDITRVDGTPFSLWISATPLIGQDGEVTGAIESFRDVTDQKRVQRALQESNAYLDAVINTLADPLFIKDRDHRFVKVNNSFCTFTGHTCKELLGHSDYDFFEQEEADIFRAKDEEVFLTGVENENEERITDSREVTHTISTKKTLYINASGEMFIVGIIRDVTERKKTELALQQALKKLNMLSSITRHDILNQLMGLRTFLDLSREDLKGTRFSEFIEKEDRAAEAIQRQIEFTRYYEDLGVQAPRWQDLAEMFLSTASQLPLGGIGVDVQVAGLEVYADPLIEKVFYNLVENSLRHGGHVTAIVLSVRETPEGEIITYRDNGAGIAAEDKGKLFQRGFGKHTGLGLFLSREILSITGISITENGEPGKGVRFEISVPKGVYRFAL